MSTIKDEKVDSSKSTEEIIDEKNAEEKEAEEERAGAEIREKPSDEQTSEAVGDIADEIPPGIGKVNLLRDAEKDKGKKRKPTTVITKKEKIPLKEGTESEPAKVEREGKEKVKKARNPKSHAFNDDDGICVRCGVHRDFATTDCFGRQLPRVTAIKVLEGKADYVNGTWIETKPDENKDDK